MPPRPKPAQPPPRPNPLRNVRPIRQPTPIRIGKSARPAKRTCSNKECETPDVHEDGICHNCGTVVEESNIVSEVTFGETSQGAAVVQGSYMAADQGHVNTMGKAFKNMGQPSGDGDNAASLQDARRWMQQLQAGLDLSQGPQILDGACGYYKLAARQNFIQGRRMDMVAAVCLYSFCRSQKPCRVMLIDFADQLQVNVFKLGHTFKALNRAVSSISTGLMPVLPEDLIWRFAHKLDFKTETNKVAEDAVRLVKRMSLDWMVMGRRPSGVCGACLILAARMNNFRRTVTEVVYVVKVTTATIQKRLDEFKRIPSSALTVEEFLSNEFLESAHDPPSYYEKQEAFIKTKKTRKRKRKGGEDPEGQANAEGGNPDAAIPSVELRRDADGFAIPPQPTQETQRPEIAIDPALLDEADLAVGEENGAALKKLVHAYGDAINDALSDDDDDDDDDEEEEGTPGPSRRGPKPHREIHVPDLWAEDERTLESQIDEIVGDPNTIAHARAYARACKRANKYMKFLHHTTPQRDVNMDVHIGEDEFADDPEVVNALLDPTDVAAKERVWVNENKAWLRKQQLKEYQKRIAADGPPKATRNRKKKPRIGEGQDKPANTPEEAAIETLKRRTWSKKINYKMVNKMLSGFEKSLGGMGSAGSSRAPSAPISEAGSMIDDDDEESENGSVIGSVAGSETSSISSRRPIIPPPRPVIASAAARPIPGLSNADVLARGPTPTPSIASKDDLIDEDDEEEEAEDWKKSLKRGRGIEDDGEEEEEDDYREDYTQGDVEIDDVDVDVDVDAAGDYEGNWDAEEDFYGAD